MSQSTPYRSRGADEGGETDGAPGSSFFSRLFSTAKKARTVEYSTGSTEMVHSNRLVLSPSRVAPQSPPAKAAPTATVTASSARAPALNGSSGVGVGGAVGAVGAVGAGAMAEWKPYDAKASFHVGAAPRGTVALQPYRRRRVPTRPQSYTLVGRSRNRPPPKDWDPADFHNILQSSRALFTRPNDSHDDDVQAVRALATRRLLGTNQRGLRLAPPVERSTKVSFQEPNTNTNTTTTANTNTRTKDVSFADLPAHTYTPKSAPNLATPKLRRQQTPGITRNQLPSATSTPDVASPASTSPFSSNRLSSISKTTPNLPRTDFNPDGPFEFDGDLEPRRRATTTTAKVLPMIIVEHRPKVIPTLHLGEQQRFERQLQAPKEIPAQTTWTVDDDDEVEEEKVTEPTASKRPKPLTEEGKVTQTSTGWGAHMFNKDRWKCTYCYVFNEMDKNKCSSCENVRPGYEAEAAASSSSKVNSASSGSSAIFSFGVVAPTTTLAPAPATGNSSSGNAPFSFGEPATGTTSSGNAPFSFGLAAPAPSKTATSSGKAPFSFGVAPAVSGTTYSGSAPFAFGTPASAPETTPSTDSKKTGAFSFGMPPPSVTGFSFATKQEESKTTTSQTKANFGFGQPPQSAPPNKKRSAEEYEPEAPKTEGKPPAGGAKFNFGAVGVGNADTTGTGPSGGASAASTEPKPFVFNTIDTKSQSSGTFPSAASKEQEDDSRRTKRRAPDDEETEKPSVSGGFTFGAPAAQAPTASALTFGAQVAPAPSPTQGLAPQAPVFTFGSSAPADKPADSKPSVSFGVTPKGSDSTSSFTFGAGSSTPASNGGANPFAGHTPGPSTTPYTPNSTPAPTFGFGASATPASTNNTFQAGSTPAPPNFGAGSTTLAPANQFSFGGTPGPALNNTFGVGSTPAPPTFGSTPAPPFGGTPAAGGFVSAPSLSFGATPAPSVSFGATPAPSVSFGSTPAPNGGSFGAPVPTPGVSFGTAPVFGSAPPFNSGMPAPVVPAFGTTGGFGTTPVQPTNNSFGANTAPSNNFGAGPAANSFGATTAMNTPGAGGFTIGSSTKSTGRRIVRAKRPTQR